MKIQMEIFRKIKNENIRYIHWKSSEHLTQAMQGYTDLDILVHEEDEVLLVHILEDAGFRRFQSIGKQQYISIQDYLLFDSEGQKLLHFHLHSRLALGTRFFKEYVLPIEQDLLENRIWDKINCIYTINYTYEIVLLWVRYCVKQDFMKFAFHGGKISKHYLRESFWLQDRINLKEVEVIAKKIFNDEVFASLLVDFIQTNYNRKSFIRLMKRVKKIMKKYRSNSFVKIRYYFEKVHMILNYIKQRFFSMAIPYRRINPSGGSIITFIGADGSGKTSLYKHTKKIMEKKIDVYSQYFGSGDGKSSFLRYPMILAQRVLKKIINRPVKKVSNTFDLSKKNKITFSKLLWAISLTIEKKRKLFKVWKARNSGMMVLCDRYPQTQFMNINDGPLLSGWLSENGFRKRIALWERRTYELAQVLKPDLVIKLNVDVDTAIKRKPFEKYEVVARKIELIKELEIPCGYCIEIDACKSFEEVVKNAFDAISNQLQ